MTIHYISPDLSFKGSNRSKKKFTSFHKTELNLILSVYAQKVSQGHWKDYAIDHGEYNAVFSIYRSTFENAFLRICLLYTSPSPRDATLSRMPSSA